MLINGVETRRIIRRHYKLSKGLPRAQQSVPVDPSKYRYYVSVNDEGEFLYFKDFTNPQEVIMYWRMRGFVVEKSKNISALSEDEDTGIMIMIMLMVSIFFFIVYAKF